MGEGLFPRSAFRYQPERNEYSGPAGQRLYGGLNQKRKGKSCMLIGVRHV